MHLSVILVVALGVWNVEGFALRSKEDDGVRCFIHITKEIVGFYYQDKEAESMVEDAMKECFPKGDQADACLESKKEGFEAKFGENSADGVVDIMEGVEKVGEVVMQYCGDKTTDAELAQCGGAVLEAIKADSACNDQCDEFIDLFGQKAAECGEKAIKSGKRELKLRRVLSKLDGIKSMRNAKIFKK